LEVAIEEDIDLIVIGSSGKSGFDRFILGSVSDKVVNAAKCPVLVVH
jgi:nucleotide-binding universal stress UspA family protein